MLIEIIIILELMAFGFLALSIMPYKNTEDNSPPLLNRVVFAIVSMILFFSLAVTTVQYDYTYCYVNETSTDFGLNTTISDATCADYKIESIDLSYINWGMGFLCTMLAFVLMILVKFTDKDRKNEGID